MIPKGTGRSSCRWQPDLECGSALSVYELAWSCVANSHRPTRWWVP